MTLTFVVRNQTLLYIDTKVIPRIGSAKYLELKFKFITKDWIGLRKTLHISAGEYSEPFILESDTFQVPTYYTQQPAFTVTLLGDSDDGVVVPTNEVTMSLDESNTLWTAVPPDPQNSAYLELLKSIVPSNWGQNDPTAKDYIKNRTHWVDDDGTVHKLNPQFLPDNYGGSVDPDDIVKVVADYLAAHPIEETDPTVPEWAKAKTKPTYSAAEVGAISQSNLQAATDVALAQAKASGEFDGPRGPAGAPGKDGAGMDITGATVDQIAKISAVDASGVPTAWEPVDMPSGGGSNWAKVYDGSNTIAEEISVFEVDLTKNDPMKEFQLWLKLDANTAADWGAAKNISVTVNGETIGYFFFSHRLNTYVEFYEERSLEAMTVAKRCMSVVNLGYNVTSPMWMVEQGVKRQNNGKLSISFPAPYAGKITAKVYGRY